MFASLAIVAMLSSTVPTAVLGAASYSDELEGAYDYAYGIGITTQSSIDTANMYGSLIRSHMAKMMVNYAIEVLGLEPDTTATCNFTDIANETEELQGYIKQACQLGLMGQGITAFNPNGVVTRAQFGTVLSRALWGDENNGGDPYYVNHLKALKDAGIMNNISNPNATEVRGYVMLMLQRADEGAETPAICETEENKLACSLGLDTCPSECEEDDVVKAGSLEISLGDSLEDGSQIPANGIIKFAEVDFQAGDKNVDLKTITIEKLWLASIPSTTRVWFEKDGARVSGRAAFTTEGTAIISFAPLFRVKANATESLDLYVELNTTAGKDFQFASVEIDSTAADSDGEFTTPKLRTADYTVAGTTFDKTSNGWTSKVTDNWMEIGEFKLANNTYTGSETRDLTFKSIMLRQAGTADLENLSDVVLERNGEIVSDDYSIDGKYITFVVNDVIKHTTTATYTIKANVDTVETANDTYIFELKNDTDLNVVEKVNGFRSPITSPNNTLDTYTIAWGDLTFTRDTNTALTTTYPAGSEIVLMKGTISAKQAITLEDPTIYTKSAVAGLNSKFTTVYLKVGNSIFSYSPTATDTGVYFAGTTTINGSASVKMYATLKDTATGSVEFSSLTLNSFKNPEYVSNGVTVSSYIGSIAGIHVDIEDTALNITRTDGLWGTSTISAWAQDVTLYQAKLTSNKGNGVKVTKATFSFVASGSFNNNTSLTLYVNGVAKSTKQFNGSNVTFDNFSAIVDSSNDLTLKVEGDFTEDVANSIKLTLASLVAVDQWTSNNLPAITPVAGATFNVAVANGTIAISKDVVLSKLLLSPSTAQKLAAVKLTAVNDKVKLYNLTLNVTGIDSISNIRLVNGTTEILASSIAGNVVRFTDMSNNVLVDKDQSITYDLVADINNNITTASALEIAITTGNVRATNGLTAGTLGTTLVANAHKVFDKSVIISKDTNTNKSLTTSALRFKVNAIGKDVSLSGIDLALTTAGYTGTLTTVVYKNSVASANIVTRPTTVDANTEVTFIVAVPGALVNSSSSSQDWNISLNGIELNGLQISPFYNVGEFPMTERK